MESIKCNEGRIWIYMLNRIISVDIYWYWNPTKCKQRIVTNNKHPKSKNPEQMQSKKGN
jgi:hypothetical protein